MKTKTLTLLKHSALALGAVSATTAVQGSADYGPAIWNPPCNANYYTSGYGHKFHVCHDMEGYYLSTISYFKGCGFTGASVHYLVNGLQDSTSDAPAGEITQMISEANYAWHALCWNQHSTGTEHEGFVSNPAWYTEAQYQASAGITKHICEKFGYAKDRNHVVGHDEKRNAAWVTWANANLGINATCNTHTDPGAYWDWSHYIALINGNNASAVGISAPAKVGLGKTFSSTVTMNNNGGTSWTTAGSYRLGSQGPQDNYTWGFNRVDLQQSQVNPGQNATFTFTSTAPTTAGTYNFNWGMVQDGVQWFGGIAATTIQVAAINDASLVSISAPSSVVAGSSFSATITMNNNGNLSWTTAGSYALGSQSPQDNTTWGTGRWALPADPITAGQNAAFTRTFTAPTTPGTYTFAWKMVQDGVEWFGPVASVTITVTANLVTAIVDNSDAGFSVTGTAWATGTSATQKYGADYRYRSTAPISEPAQWTANLANTGTYNVYAWWSTGSNRSTTAPYVVNYNGGSQTVSVNQQLNGGQWNLLGTYSLLAGNNTVKLSCWTTTNSVVIADAVKWVQQ